MYVLGIATGIALGVILSALFQELRICGTLQIDSHGQRPIWRFSFDGDFDDIPKKRKIILRVDKNVDLSQESQLL